MKEQDKITQRKNFTKTNLHEVTKFHKENFAPRVNFARVTILPENKKTEKTIYKKNLLDKLIKNKKKKNY